MAKNIETKFSVNLGGVIENSIASVNATRRERQAKKEAEFQKAIANGLSYEEQVAIREEQLIEEKASSFADSGYIANLEKSITDTKKLNRFNKYRTRYAESLGELSSGKINEEDYLSILENQLQNIDDPELRLEIQGDITTAQGKVKTYKDTILSNSVKKAKYDGTKTALDNAVVAVNVARAKALINDNADEVGAYDETLSALNSQLSSVKIQDSITSFQVKSATRGTNPLEKINYINSEIQKADPNTPIRIGERTFTSAEQFWSLERDNFLAGNSEIFGNFFDELNNYTQNTVDVTSAKFGYPTQNVLDDVLQTFNDLRAKPEMAPFINRLDITQAGVMTGAVDKLAKAINAIGTNNLTFQEADSQLQNISTKYGVDVSAHRLQLDEQLRSLARSGTIDEKEALNMAPDVNLELPKVDVAKPTEPTTPATPTAGGVREVRAGDTLSDIAREAGVGLKQLIEFNPELQANPNIIRPGQQIKLPGATPGTPPTPTPPTPSSPTPASVSTPKPVTPVTPSISTPEAPKPVTTSPTPATNYTGSSIVDYLKSIGQDSSFGERKNLATQKGVQNYVGSAEQNNNLLKLLRG